MSAAALSERVYTWELPVRLSHWLIAGSMLVLAATGFYVGHPFIVVPGEARFHFVMGTVRAVHSYAAIVFSVSVLARLAWMVLGNRWARWDQFLPVAAERRGQLLDTLRFYLFLRPRAPETTGHNPLAGLAYTAVFGLYVFEILSGLALYSVSASPDSPAKAFGFVLGIFGGPQTVRFLHHGVMWLLLGFAVHHVYSALLVAMVEKNGTMESIFSGFKFMPARRGGGGGEAA